MTLIQYTAPEYDGIYDYCKRRFEVRMKLRKLPLLNYLTLETARRIYPDKKKLMTKLFNSSIIHGFQVNNGPILFHPDPLFKSIGRLQKKYLKKELVSLPIPDLPH